MSQGKRTNWRFGLVATCVLCVCAAFPARGQSPGSSDSSEYLIKAGFIYNFAKLMEWPDPVFPQPNSPIVIGVLGNTDPFQGTLDDVLKGKQVNGHPFVVRHLKSRDDIKGCNILFVTSSEATHVDELLHQVRGLPILTIGDTPGFAERGGIINFVVEDNKVRFDIDVQAAKQADINISSRLLALARIVPDMATDGRKSQ